METEKTRLQKIKEQLEQKMTRAIVEAIEDGAKCEIVGDGVRIDEVYLTPKFGFKYHGLVFNIDAPEIDQLFTPTRVELEKMAAQKRAELEEIEKQLKSE